MNSNEIMNESKQMIQEAIAEKLREMNNLAFDLTESEIEDIQDVIESDNDDAVNFDNPDVFFAENNTSVDGVVIIPHDAVMPVPYNGSKIDPELFEQGKHMLQSALEIQTDEQSTSMTSVVGTSDAFIGSTANSNAFEKGQKSALDINPNDDADTNERIDFSAVASTPSINVLL